MQVALGRRSNWGGRSCFVVVLMLWASAPVGAQSKSQTMPDTRTEEAIALMLAFAERTGLTSERPPQRYLWTDAFAVCNFLGLVQLTGEEKYRELALRLVDQVHQTLGQHRADDPRSGWISGLGAREGALHPTRGGLRIGKKLPERSPEAVLDERMEWDRDGQYFHYLTKWMHALDQVTRATGLREYNLWARELAATAHAAFVYPPVPGRPGGGMYWKMSIDLTRPLVPSMGQHDPLDGYLTYMQLRSTAAVLPQPVGAPALDVATKQLAAMIAEGEWTTADPLGLGGLLVDAYRVDQLRRRGAPLAEGLLERLLTASLAGLHYFARSGELAGPAEYRLAFRELGLAVGLHAVARMSQAVDTDPEFASSDTIVRARLHALRRYVPMADDIESFWRDPAHRRAGTWTEHRDINEVMLATSLAPAGFLVMAGAE